MLSESSKLVMLNNLLSTKLAKKIDGPLSSHGISFTEYMILLHLFEAPNNVLRRIDLAELVGLTASGVTRLLAPMEKNHLIEKELNPRDARVSLVKISDTGLKIFTESSVTFEHNTQGMLSKLSNTQISKFVELTEKLL